MEHVFNEVHELEKTEAVPSPSVESEQQVPAKVSTAISEELVRRIGDAFANPPEGFTLHKRVRPVMQRRATMAREGGIDWAFAELLAFGSLVAEGRTVRLAGQDSRRGTFTQRHSVIIDRDTGAEYTPLATLDDPDAERAGKFLVYDSTLSEYAAVGFEYGYSVSNPAALVCWEAQYGDFVNNAQGVIDEYISSSEAKWGQRSDVVMLLPHGHEGQGPDHTSGRIERWLQLCAEGSMMVAQPSTPANYFHLLRRHMLDGVSRPLVVFTPKSMLRSKEAVSQVADFTGSSKFQSVLDDPRAPDPDGVKRVLLTSGKLYYQLAKEVAEAGRDDIAVLRVEQYYPLPSKKLATALERYPGVADIRWCQDEPENQGAWPFLGMHLPRALPGALPALRVVSRRPMSAPASGSARVHEAEEQAILHAALSD
jgi:2-oxoglutarate decarboxylase